MKSRCQKGSKAVSGKGGFTLIELLAVVVIIGLLTGLILGVSSIANRKAAEAQARADIEELKMALEQYRVINGSYLTPPTVNTTNMTVDGVFNVLTNTQYSKSLTFPQRFQDPWGRPYIYERLGDFQFRLYSQGHDPTEPSTDIR